MKKFAWVGLLVIAGLLFVKGSGQAADLKIGVVDISKIFSSYTKVTENQAEFDKFRQEQTEEAQKKVDAADKEIKAMQDKLDSKAINKETSDKIKADIEKKKQEVLDLQRDVYQKIQTKNRELVEARVKDIEAAIAKLAKENGYAFVINKEAVLYSPEASDLSDQVIAALNKPTAVKK